MVTLYQNNQLGGDRLKSSVAAPQAAIPSGISTPVLRSLAATMTPRASSSHSLASAASEASSHAEGDRCRIRFSFGGTFSRAPNDGAWRYQGGNSYLESLPLSCTYSELMFLLSEKVQKTVSVKYQIPGEELDPDQLISVGDDGDLQEMYDEYIQGLSRPGTPAKTFRLRIFLFQAQEHVYIPKDSRRSSANGDHDQSSEIEVVGHNPSEACNNSSWSSIGSSNSVVSQHSSGSKFSRSAKGGGFATGGTSSGHLTRRNSVSPTSAAAAAWEEGFRAGQDASAFQEEAFMWQELIVSKLSRATKHCSFTADPWDFDCDAEDELKNADLTYHNHFDELQNDLSNMPYGDNPSAVFADTWNQGPVVGPAGLVEGLLQQTLSSPNIAGASPEWGNGAANLNWGINTPKDDGPDQLMSRLNLGPNPVCGGEEAWVERVAAAGAVGRGAVQKLHLDTEAASPLLAPILPVMAPEACEVNLPKLGSDLGVGTSTVIALNAPTQDDEAEAQGDGHPRLPSQLGVDLGNDKVSAAQRHPPAAVGAGYSDLPSPGSPSMLGRQLSQTSWDGRSDSVHFVPANDVKVLAKIGEGAFGEVSLATVPIFGKVAVKWLKPKKLTTHNQAFWQEAELLGTLNHPHVIRFFGVVVESPQSQQVVGIITEYLVGGSLSALLHTPEGMPPLPPLPVLQRAELALGAANGMSYLHELRVVHFDLKPDNLLVDGDLSSANAAVKVADFGLSKHKYTSYVTGCRDLRGTLPYMAPELVSDPDHVTEKADVWSMGIVLWELVARQIPYENLSPQQIVAGLMQGYLRPEIPEWVEDEWRLLIESCLDFNPQARPSFRELSSKLERVRDEAAFLVT